MHKPSKERKPEKTYTASPRGISINESHKNGIHSGAAFTNISILELHLCMQPPTPQFERFGTFVMSCIC